MPRLSRLFASMLVLVVVASACTSGSAQPRSGQSKNANYAKNATFTMVVPDDLGPFDPYRSNLIKFYYKLAYDSMVHLRPDGKIVSGLAEKWTVNARSASFVLRSAVTCSDGTRLTASQVAADLTYLGDPKNKSSLYGSQIPSVPFVVSGDDATRTVKVTMSAPFGFLLRTIGTAPIVCANGLKNPESLARASDGTGPFVLTAVVPGQSYTFTVREGYRWGPGGASTSEPGTPAKVVLRVINNETTSANLLLSGEVNWAPIGGEDRKRLDAQGVDNVKMPASGAWLWFNHLAHRPTADKAVRQALVQALDLEEVVRVSGGGTGSASTGLSTTSAPTCRGTAVAGHLPKHDVAAAKTRLDEAGWTAGADGIRRKNGRAFALDLHYTPTLSAYDRPTAELIAERWKEIGVRVKLSPDSNVSMNRVAFQTSDYDVFMLGLGSSLPSVFVKYISGPVPPNGVNLAGIDNKDYEALAAKAITMTPPQACTYWNQAELALWRDADMTPISNRPLVWYLNHARAELNGSEIPVPTSIRVVE